MARSSRWLRMSQKMAASSLTGAQLKAAQLVADGELTEEAIAAQVDVARRTLVRWKVRPDFEQRVAIIRTETAAALKAEGIRQRENRLQALDDRQRALMKVVEERAEDGGPRGAFYRVPGYSSGYMVLNVKFGPEGERVSLYEVDTGLVAALNAVEKQAAQDSGQWTEKQEVNSGKGATIINAVFLGVPRPDFAQIGEQSVDETP